MGAAHEKVQRNAKMAWYYTEIGASASELARFYGVRRTTVLKILKRLGVAIRPRGKRHAVSGPTPEEHQQ